MLKSRSEATTMHPFHLLVVSRVLLFSPLSSFLYIIPVVLRTLMNQVSPLLIHSILHSLRTLSEFYCNIEPQFVSRVGFPGCINNLLRRHKSVCFTRIGICHDCVIMLQLTIRLLGANTLWEPPFARLLGKLCISLALTSSSEGDDGSKQLDPFRSLAGICLPFTLLV